VIEINLLPGSVKRQKKRLPSFRTGNLRRPQLPALNRGRAWLAVVWVAGLGVLAWLHFSSTGTLRQLEVDVQAAQRDSVRLAQLRALNDSLQGRITAVGARLEVLQEIDAGRYMWAHVFDEVSRALPQYTWLVSLEEVDAAAGDRTRIRITGRTGNTFALARFMQELEASPFLQRVTIVSQAEVVENEKSVYAFTLDLDYQEPPPDAIELRPLISAAAEPLGGETAVAEPVRTEED
jgi:Tfp pilus assembly protein PilN